VSQPDARHPGYGQISARTESDVHAITGHPAITWTVHSSPATGWQPVGLFASVKITARRGERALSCPLGPYSPIIWCALDDRVVLYQPQLKHSSQYSPPIERPASMATKCFAAGAPSPRLHNPHPASILTHVYMLAILAHLVIHVPGLLCLVVAELGLAATCTPGVPPPCPAP
jgi:hypothetical protein